jgi:hypothetical protein
LLLLLLLHRILSSRRSSVLLCLHNHAGRHRNLQLRPSALRVGYATQLSLPQAHVLHVR